MLHRQQQIPTSSCLWFFCSLWYLVSDATCESLSEYHKRTTTPPCNKLFSLCLIHQYYSNNSQRLSEGARTLFQAIPFDWSSRAREYTGGDSTIKSAQRTTCSKHGYSISENHSVAGSNWLHKFQLAAGQQRRVFFLRAGRGFTSTFGRFERVLSEGELMSWSSCAQGQKLSLLSSIIKKNLLLLALFFFKPATARKKEKKRGKQWWDQKEKKFVRAIICKSAYGYKAL